MKIGLVSPYDLAYPGGVTNHITQLAKQFHDWGHDVKVIGPTSNPKETITRDYYIPMGRTVPFPSGGSLARISLSFWLEPKIKSLLKKERFDVIHIHEPFSSFLPLCVLFLSKTINVGTFHAFRDSPRLYGISKFLLTRWFKKLDGRIAVSKPAMQFVGRHFPGDYHIIPNGIDIDHFSKGIKPIDKWNDGKINILFVGRLEKRKGLKYLISAFGDLKWNHSNLRLIVVGPGNLDEESQRIVSARKIEDIVIQGSVSHSDLPRYYNSADIFCAPNTGRESFGIILGEAMAATKPIVASGIEGFKSVITDGQEGILVKPKDSNQLAKALATLIDNPELRHRMGANGRQRVEEFRWEKVAGEVLTYYKDLLKFKVDKSES